MNHSQLSNLKVQERSKVHPESHCSTTHFGVTGATIPWKFTHPKCIDSCPCALISPALLGSTATTKMLHVQEKILPLSAGWESYKFQRCDFFQGGLRSRVAIKILVVWLWKWHLVLISIVYESLFDSVQVYMPISVINLFYSIFSLRDQSFYQDGLKLK